MKQGFKLYAGQLCSLILHASHCLLCVWNTGYIHDGKLLQSVQQCWTRQIQDLSSLSYPDRLRSLNLYSVYVRLLCNDLIKNWKIFHEHSTIEPDDLSVKALLTGTHSHQYKIAYIRISLYSKEIF